MFSKGLMTLVFIMLVNTIILLSMCFLGILLHKIRTLNVIQMKQYFITTSSTCIIACLFPPLVTTMLFIVLFFIYKYWLFKNDAYTIQYIYALYNDEVHLAPTLNKFSEVFERKYEHKSREFLKKDYLYSFSRYLNGTIYIFIVYCIRGTVQPEHVVLYGLEYFIVATTLFITIAKAIYHLALFAPNSLFFLCPKSSYIPVAIIAILFYGIAIFVFISTL